MSTQLADSFKQFSLRLTLAHTSGHLTFDELRLLFLTWLTIYAKNKPFCPSNEELAKDFQCNPSRAYEMIRHLEAICILEVTYGKTSGRYLSIRPEENWQIP